MWTLRILWINWMPSQYCRRLYLLLRQSVSKASYQEPLWWHLYVRHSWPPCRQPVCESPCGDTARFHHGESRASRCARPDCVMMYLLSPVVSSWGGHDIKGWYTLTYAGRCTGRDGQCATTCIQWDLRYLDMPQPIATWLQRVVVTWLASMNVMMVACCLITIPWDRTGQWAGLIVDLWISVFLWEILLDSWNHGRCRCVLDQRWLYPTYMMITWPNMV